VAGKHTLAVRLGDLGARRFYVALVSAALLCPCFIALARPRALIALAVVPLAVRPIRRVLSGAQGLALVAALSDTARLQLLFAGTLALGVWPR
jgi:1,4-dihydroxy-2-naphthoate octaprenyltransferase